ncbi:MAG: BTAD domain-containing putative transcriptional regulator [Actinomycetota bacterium]
MADVVSIRLFGRFRAAVDRARPVGVDDFERKTGAELVQLLALSDGHQLHRDQVLDALWPHADLDKATNAFYKAASFARRPLGEDAIQVDRQMVTLFAGSTVEVDAAVVASATADDPDSIDAALAVWSDPFLPTVPYSDWARRARDRLHRHLLAVLAEAGRWSDLFELDPTDERAARALMVAAVDAGDPATALRCFRRLDTALREDLGVGPTAAVLSVRDRAEAAAPVAGRPAATVSRRRGQTVPPPTGPLFGRSDDRATVLQALASHRLVTIVGPGGIGKTALARDVGADPGDRWPDGAHWCRLGTVTDEQAAGRELLAAIGGQQWQDASVTESIVRTVADDTTLIVLDNAEHLAEHLHPLLTDVLTQCADVRFLVTSRRPVDLPDEYVHRLDRLDPVSAASLFRADAARAGLTIAVDDQLDVDRLCERLDRLPLAVRLGAARAGAVGLDLVERHLADRFRFLDRGAAGGQEKTLEEAIAWSVDALRPATRTVLTELSTIVGTFSLDTAVAVAGVGDTLDMIEHLDELVEASLVERTTTDREPRHRLLESVRLHARAIADREGSAAGATERHRRHVLAGAAAAKQLIGRDSAAGLRWFAESWPDVQLAASTCIAAGDRRSLAELIASCSTYAVLTQRFGIIDWCEAGLDPDDVDDPVAATEEHAVALATWATMERYLGQIERAARLLDAAAVVDPQPAEVLIGRGMAAHAAGDAEGCLTSLTDGLERPMDPANEAVVWLQLIMVEAGRGRETADHVHRLSVLAAGRGPMFRALHLLGRAIGSLASDPVQSRVDLEEAMVIGDGLGAVTVSAQSRTALPMAAVMAGRSLEALALERDAITWTSERGVWSMATAALGTLGLLLDGHGDTANAVTLISARIANGAATAFNIASIHAVADRARETHPEQFEGWWDAGSRLDRRAAADLGIEAADAVLAAVDRGERDGAAL